MTDSHSVVQFVGGDDWQFNVTLFDENDKVYDLSGSPTIKWALLNTAETRVLDTSDVIVTVTEPMAGKLSIVVPAVKTTALSAGQYTDVLRLVLGGITSTMTYGPIFVMADPWKVQSLALRVVA